MVFQPATVASSQVSRSCWDWGWWPSSARRTRIRWTDSAMFSQDPLIGVYSGMMPCWNNQSTMVPLRWPARLSQTSKHAKRWQRPGRLVAEPGCPARQRRPLVFGKRQRRETRQHRGQFRLEPRMKDGVGRGRDTLSADLAGRGAQQRQEPGRPAADVLMGLAHRLPHRRPGDPGLGDRLVRPGLILTPERQPGRFG